MTRDPKIGELRFLYVGAGDTTAAVDFYTRSLGGRVRWRFQRFGADVAGVELDSGPLVLLADHRPPGSVLPIWTVPDLAAQLDDLRAAGLSVRGPEGTPEGDVIVVDGPGGAELAFIEVVRPDALDHAFADDTNTHRVDP